MTYVITQNCCKDASCISVCPVDCIRPDRDVHESGLQMLYIDPDTCVDCGACEVECPVDAIYYEDDLPPEQVRYGDINADYFRRHPLDAKPSLNSRERDSVDPGSLRIAIVGAGPAACYAAADLLDIEGTEISIFDSLPTPFGLIRAGVAPDHQRTKGIIDLLGSALANPRVRCHFNVEVGRDVTPDELLAHHHAVIYGVGASKSRRLGIPGEELNGSVAAADFVAWYNGHPDHSDAQFDLSCQRAVVIGNGNVALDIARILLASDEDLTATDVADHALSALSSSMIEEVVILGRRTPRHAAFSAAEFLALGYLPGVDVVIESDDLAPDSGDDDETALKLQLAREYVARTVTPGNKRIVFRFMTSPVEMSGAGRVEALYTTSNTFDETGTLISGDRSESHTIETGLVLRSIGYHGTPIAGVPFDADAGRIPNVHGRVHDECGTALPGVYVTGWVKRGPRGVIGTNRACARETVAALWEDYQAGVLSKDVPHHHQMPQVLEQRGVQVVDWKGWRAIDAAERAGGADIGRPRVKLVDRRRMLSVAQASQASGRTCFPTE
ncbi:FAD-dependent oxidoreductase [Mycobacterium kyogaense]|uniref:FAD-dependent oxidoreductase n=1 Tax=Mycobacterium kyogaense TaxID=2212479 RepID=UPI000DAB88C4|nr:FAD-dependent oxidoreductase [Mycobacterium kyogaense]